MTPSNGIKNCIPDALMGGRPDTSKASANLRSPAVIFPIRCVPQGGKEFFHSTSSVRVVVPPGFSAEERSFYVRSLPFLPVRSTMDQPTCLFYLHFASFPVPSPKSISAVDATCTSVTRSANVWLLYIITVR